MPVPEAAMNEDGGLMFLKDDVRLARQVPRMKAEPIAGCMEELPQPDLRRRVFAPYPGHVPTAPFLRNLVRQESQSFIASRTSAMMAAICLAR